MDTMMLVIRLAVAVATLALLSSIPAAAQYGGTSIATPKAYSPNLNKSNAATKAAASGPVVLRRSDHNMKYGSKVNGSTYVDPNGPAIDRALKPLTSGFPDMNPCPEGKAC
jgi:hypothetical protein